MKKLSTLFILIIITITGLFANPKIPKVDNYFDTLSDDYTGTNYLFYINNSGTNSYKLFAEITSKKNTLYFTNTSLITNIEISLCMIFPSEKDLDNYISNIDTSNLEIEFNSIRNTFIKYDIKPVYSTGEKNKVTKILYTAHQE